MPTVNANRSVTTTVGTAEVTRVVFAQRWDGVEITNATGGKLYYRLDGQDPTVGGADVGVILGQQSKLLMGPVSEVRLIGDQQIYTVVEGVSRSNVQ